MAEFSDLLGKVLIEAYKDIFEGDDTIIFEIENGQRYKMYHDQECCENVHIKDIVGDMNDLIGSPILQAEVSSNMDGDDEWTFYKLNTIKGGVTISWCADTDSYYSTEVEFKQMDN